MPKLILAFLVAIFGVLGLSSQCYLVALGDIREELGVTSGDLQFANTSLHVGALLAVVSGPLVDSFGRRKGVLTGLFMYMIAALGMMLVQSYWQLLVLRFIFGMALGVLVIVTFPIMNDWNKGNVNHNARHLSLIVGLTCLIPILIPLVAQYIMDAAGWRSLMLILVIYSGCLMIWGWYSVQESGSRVPLEFVKYYKAYQGYFYEKVTRFYLLSMGAAIASLITLGASVPLMLKDDFHLPGEEIAWFLSFFLLVKAIACLGNFLLQRYLSAWQILMSALFLKLLIAFSLLFVGDNIVLFLSWQALFIVPSTLMYISSKAMMIACHSDTAGTITSAGMFTAILIATISSSALGLVENTTVMAMAVVMLALSIVPLLFGVPLKRQLI